MITYLQLELVLYQEFILKVQSVETLRALSTTTFMFRAGTSKGLYALKQATQHTAPLKANDNTYLELE